MYDIALNSESDLIIQNGDFLVIESTYQEVKTILENPPGSLKLEPILGMDLLDELDNDGGSNFKSELKKMLKRDRKAIKSYKLENGKLLLDVENI